MNTAPAQSELGSRADDAADALEHKVERTIGFQGLIITASELVRLPPGRAAALTVFNEFLTARGDDRF